MAYLVLADALARAKERSGATSANDAFLTEVLNFSAGKTAANVTHYRPYYAAAKFLEQAQSIHKISKADGAEFTGLAVPIASLLNLQAAYDAANELIIPAGFEAIPVADQTSQGQVFRFFGPRSLPTTSRP